MDAEARNEMESALKMFEQVITTFAKHSIALEGDDEPIPMSTLIKLHSQLLEKIKNTCEE